MQLDFITAPALGQAKKWYGIDATDDEAQILVVIKKMRAAFVLTDVRHPDYNIELGCFDSLDDACRHARDYLCDSRVNQENMEVTHNVRQKAG